MRPLRVQHMLKTVSPDLRSFMMKAGLGPAFTGGLGLIPCPQAVEIIFTFSLDHELPDAEDVLSEAGLDFYLIQTPKELNGTLSLALVTDEPDRLTEYLDALKRARLKPEAVYLRCGGHFTAI